MVSLSFTVSFEFGLVVKHYSVDFRARIYYRCCAFWKQCRILYL